MLLVVGSVQRHRLPDLPQVRQTLHHFGLFAGAVQSFYDGPLSDRIFEQPQRKILRQTITSMLAGDVFNSPRVWWRLQLFKLIYLWNFANLWRRSLRNRRIRRRQVGVVFEGEDLV